MKQLIVLLGTVMLGLIIVLGMILGPGTDSMETQAGALGEKGRTEIQKLINE